MLGWTVLLPLKALPQAKSRLQPASAGAEDHARLVRAMRADTLAALQDARSVRRVLVILDRLDPGYPQALVQQHAGLNAALSEGAAVAAAQWPDDGIAAVVGDLPALRGADVDDALASAASRERSFVSDAQGTGTTMLAVRPGVVLDPQFGPGSAARHQETGAQPIVAVDGLRSDVDTPADLCRAAEVGLGPRTQAVAAPVTCG